MADVSPAFIAQAVTSLVPAFQDAVDRWRLRHSPDVQGTTGIYRHQANLAAGGFGGAFGEGVSAQEAYHQYLVDYLASEMNPYRAGLEALGAMGSQSAAPAFQSAMPGGGALDVGQVPDLSQFASLFGAVRPQIVPPEQRVPPSEPAIETPPDPWGTRIREGVQEARGHGDSLLDRFRAFRQGLGDQLRERLPWNQSSNKSGVPSYQTGTPYVPRTGLAQLHEGEAVVPREQNPWAQRLTPPNPWERAAITGQPMPPRPPQTLGQVVNPMVYQQGSQQPADTAHKPFVQPAQAAPYSPAQTQTQTQGASLNPVVDPQQYLHGVQGQAGAASPLMDMLSQNPTGFGQGTMDALYNRSKEAIDAEYAALQRQLQQQAAGMGRLPTGGHAEDMFRLQDQRMRDLASARRDIDLGAAQQQHQNLVQSAALGQQDLTRQFGELSTLAQLGEMLNAGSFGRGMQEQQFRLESELGRGALDLQRELGRGNLGLQRDLGLGGLQLDENRFVQDVYQQSWARAMDMVDRLVQLGLSDHDATLAVFQALGQGGDPSQLLGAVTGGYTGGQ